jgi:hypothetical protein
MPGAQNLSYPASPNAGKPSANRDLHSCWSLGVLVSHGPGGPWDSGGLSDLQHKPDDPAAHMPQQAACMHITAIGMKQAMKQAARHNGLEPNC